MTNDDKPGDRKGDDSRDRDPNAGDYGGSDSPESSSEQPPDERTPNEQPRNEEPRNEQNDEVPFRAPRGISPTKTHGTRVKFNIVCPRCKREDTLPFVPRTRGEILCHVCAEEIFGQDWAHGRKLDYPEEHAFKCVKCGRKDYVRFKPRPDKMMLCRPCLRGDDPPRTD